MKEQQARLISVSVGTGDDMSKQTRDDVIAELDGFVGDKHRGYSRVCYEGDTEPEGTVRRNNRQWSAMSKEEVEEIQAALDLTEPLSPEDLGVNLVVEGIDAFSRLAKGTKLIFPSGATLVVEAYNPPCTEMGDKIASLYRTRSGQSLTRRLFLKEAKRKRGLVGVVDVPGTLAGGDLIVVEAYRAPKLA